MLPAYKPLPWLTADVCVDFLRNFGEAGGALLCGAAQVSNCEFRSNGTGDGGFGGAIAAQSGAVISNCVFESNIASSGNVGIGGAIDARGAVTIISSIFVNNFASGIFGEGGAVSFLFLVPQASCKTASSSAIRLTVRSRTAEEPSRRGKEHWLRTARSWQVLGATQEA